MTVRPRRRMTPLAPELRHLMQRLVLSYRGAVPAGEVIRCVAVAHGTLRRAGVHDLAQVEAVARRRLAQRCVPSPRSSPGVLALLLALEPFAAVLG